METNCPGGPVEHLVGRLRVAATKLGRSDEWEDLRDDLHHAAAEIERLRAAEDTGVDQPLWDKLVELGIVGIRTIEPQDGGMTLMDAAIVAEEAGRHVAPVPLIEAIVAIALLLIAIPAIRLALPDAPVPLVPVAAAAGDFAASSAAFLASSSAFFFWFSSFFLRAASRSSDTTRYTSLNCLPSASTLVVSISKPSLALASGVMAMTAPSVAEMASDSLKMRPGFFGSGLASFL